MPPADDLTKPTLFHCLRVGVYLYKNNYPENIVLAGLLHDVIEDTKIKKEELSKEFNYEIAELVEANSKDKTISDSDARIKELIQRCIAAGQDAAIVKAADVLDNYKYFAKIEDPDGLKYCGKNASTMFQHLPPSFTDKVFEELRKLHEINSPLT